MNDTQKQMIAYTIKTTIASIRECRKDRSVPCMMGMGHTVAIEGSIASVARVGTGFNFSGTWNRETSYYTQPKAEELRALLQPYYPDHKLEVVHHNTLRDRTEAQSLKLLKEYIKLARLARKS